MPDASRRARIQRALQNLRERAETLSARERDQSVKDMAAHALADLDDAQMWLDVPGGRSPDAERRWVSFIEALIASAQARLDVADLHRNKP